jgi:hypothetical protein
LLLRYGVGDWRAWRLLSSLMSLDHEDLHTAMYAGGATPASLAWMLFAG